MSVYQENNRDISVNTSQIRNTYEEAGMGVWTVFGGDWTRPGAVGVKRGSYL